MMTTNLKRKLQLWVKSRHFSKHTCTIWRTV